MTRLSPTPEQFYSDHKEAALAVSDIPQEVLDSSLGVEDLRIAERQVKRPDSRKGKKILTASIDAQNAHARLLEKYSIPPRSDATRAIIHYAYVTEAAKRHYQANRQAYEEDAIENQ